ncbi:protein mono-ADP-ribosyltransferase PARP10 [Chamaea fasciata]|uniref:protein mono-ADP-ribosyltransferase PARP10 n=1 Tax=Chamaea fasciata TaxID=190680 RepID=UPI00336AA59E
MARGVLEVQGVPPDAPEELLILYFENRRRSGGGPVQSCQRLGPLLFLTFEDPRDAQNVLAHGSHRLGGVELRVRPAPPWDPTHLLLHSPDPRTPSEPLRPPLETLLGVPPGTVTLCRGSVPGWSLLRLQEPLTPPELASAERRARQRGLELLRVPRSPAVLVRAAGPLPSRDLLELYFENRRSGGGRVGNVRLLPGGRGAIVTFQELAAAERVLQRPHRLQDVVLELDPHYPFLELLEGSRDVPLDTVPTPDRAPPPPDTEPLLLMDLLLDGDCPADTEPSSEPTMARTNPSPDTAAAVLVPAAPTSHPVPGQPPAAIPSRDKDTEGFRAMPSQAQRPVPVPVVVPEPMSAVPMQDEVLVPAEPGALRYLQLHYQDMLSSVPEVSLLPLEGGDISGFRVSGEPGRCRAVADFLQSLLDSVASHPTTLRFPGVSRFLWDPAGQSLLQQLESHFQCVIQLEGEPWTPPDPQLELEELLPPRSHRHPRSHSWHRDQPEGDDPAADDNGDAGDSGFRSNAEEIKEVMMAALHPSHASCGGGPNLWPDSEWDPEAEIPCAAGGDGAKELLSDPREVLSDTRVEEEVQMALAIQYSMDRTWCEEQELARATALSLRSYSREQEQERAEEDARLLAALEASLEEALPAADAARVTAFCSSERDASAAPRELERVLAARLRAREVASEQLRALPAAGRCALALLRCRHAVDLSLSGDTATLRGFAEYVDPATQELASLLQRLPPPEHGATTAISATPATPATAHWVRWDDSGTAVRYTPEAAALLEQAWMRQERRLDLVLGGRPFTVDLERMEEFDIGSARAVPVCRSQPPLDSTYCLLGPEVAGQEEEVRLMALAEDSEEFTDAVQHFCGTLEELHSQISIVQVQKLIHPVLYKQYQLKKGSVKRACAAGTAAERVLFHGTTKASSREICLHGFNRSFCGKNATLYGLGVYFAARAAISARDRYSPPSASGTKFIFVAKVLTGEFTAGRPGLRAPPLREGSGVPRRFHSVVDDPRQPDIFVIFNDTQAYPQYLITCRSRHGGPL